MTTQKIRDKLAKLLRLAAHNPNDKEAAAAYARAAALAERHALNLDDLDISDDASADVPEIEDMEKRRVLVCDKCLLWKWTLIKGIAEAHRCGAYSSTGTRYVRKNWRGEVVERVKYSDTDEHGIWIYGQPHDMDTVAYLVAAILPEVDRRGSAYVAASPSRGRRDGRAFRAGMADEIATRMRETTKNVLAEARTQAYAKSGETGLARVNAVALHVEQVQAAVEHYGKHTLNLKTSSPFAGVRKHGYEAGRVAGRNVNIGSNKAIG